VPRALLKAPESMSVTEFKRFLDCPYRYALEKLLRLKCYDDGFAELNPMSFGSLAHDVLCALGDDAIARSEDRDEIFVFLKQRLDALVRERFGGHPLPAMLVQIARLEQRFWSFSAFQAGSVSEGWRIRECEVKLDDTVCLDVPGEDPMPLRARIDRIDEHPATGRWRVIDYKTGERGDDPIRTHHAAVKLPDTVVGLQWRDLQLPLYHLLVTQSEQLRLPKSSIELGYIVLPKQSDGARWHIAPWTMAHLQHGLDAARQVVRDIRAAVRSGKFNMNRDIDSRFDDFARICQTTAFSAPDGDVESEPANGFGGDE
jgi:ATP-dependent helicase/DNAse subunit B